MPLGRWRTAFCYGAIGVLGTIIHFGTLFLLVEHADFTPLIASTIGFVFTVVVSYLFNYYWTFAAASAHRSTFLRYLVVSLTGLTLNAIVLQAGLSLLDLHYTYAQAMVILIIPVVNYLLNRFWTFNNHDAAAIS